MESKSSVFLTFGTTDGYAGSLKRISREALGMGVFAAVLAYDENNLGREFLDKHADFIRSNRRGYGYWLWKPYIVLRTLERMKEGDVLLYADAGCTLNKAAVGRLKEYIAMCQGPEGNVGFQMGHLDVHWCKMDVIERLEAHEHAGTGQFIATSFLIRKCPRTVEMVRRWYELAQDYHMIDDTPSVAANVPGFREHRHDQALFSLIRKLYGVIALDDETYSVPFKQSSPIWATRLKN